MRTTKYQCNQSLQNKDGNTKSTKSIIESISQNDAPKREILRQRRQTTRNLLTKDRLPILNGILDSTMLESESVEFEYFHFRFASAFDLAGGGAVG